eukprot:TRINITY_DN3549_c0_g1_i1.p2 TRINITY_DN3549_c0_g1~~TRINITY_DN3549_c0_g1_i1.p2  ORF type:complete len:209 (+),score=40.32 TRINITY_DN3549_c0_g1_i1:935-1561(+)
MFSLNANNPIETDFLVLVTRDPKYGGPVTGLWLRWYEHHGPLEPPEDPAWSLAHSIWTDATAAQLMDPSCPMIAPVDLLDGRALQRRFLCIERHTAKVPLVSIKLIYRSSILGRHVEQAGSESGLLVQPIQPPYSVIRKAGEKQHSDENLTLVPGHAGLYFSVMRQSGYDFFGYTRQLQRRESSATIYSPGGTDTTEEDSSCQCCWGT